MEGIGTAPVTNNGYKYNGKELNEDLGLNLSDYGARWYDASLGRWWSVDPMGEKQSNWSEYGYTINNPLLFIDPNGMESEAYSSVSTLGRIKEQYEMALLHESPRIG
jgi:RHS repeat-associated protein